jgi:uncharacterized caspase-like protein
MNQGLNLFAEALVFVHGTGALKEAERHARLCAVAGDDETAIKWLEIGSVVRDINTAKLS